MTDGSANRPPAQPATFLVTGSLGCIGAWTLYHLVARGHRTISYDLSEDRRRLDLLLDRDRQDSITFVTGEVTDLDRLQSVIAEHGVNRIVHLAALQIPFCKADPVTGARVNVVGTVCMFEAARRSGIEHLAYASSIAAYAGEPDGVAYECAAGNQGPDTLYGVFKRANEGTARVYWRDHGVSSIGLRPYTVYGIGRDQGLTSEPTLAMLAAAKGEPYQISFGGRMQFHLASDVAEQFIEAASTRIDGARVFNLGTEPVAIAELVDVIREVRPDSRVSHVERPLPFAEGFDAGELRRYLTGFEETPLVEGVRRTIEHFKRLLDEGKLAR